MIHPILSPLQLFLEEDSIQVKISVAKPGIKNHFMYLAPLLGKHEV